MAKKLRKYAKIRPTKNPIFLLVSGCIYIQVYKSSWIKHIEQK